MYRSKITCPAGGCRKHNFWTAHVKPIKYLTFEILTSRATDWYIYGSNWGGGGGGWSSGVDLFFYEGLQFYSGPLPRNLKYII